MLINYHIAHSVFLLEQPANPSFAWGTDCLSPRIHNAIMIQPDFNATYYGVRKSHVETIAVPPVAKTGIICKAAVFEDGVMQGNRISNIHILLNLLQLLQLLIPDAKFLPNGIKLPDYRIIQITELIDSKLKYLRPVFKLSLISLAVSCFQPIFFQSLPVPAILNGYKGQENKDGYRPEILPNEFNQYVHTVKYRIICHQHKYISTFLTALTWADAIFCLPAFDIISLQSS